MANGNKRGKNTKRNLFVLVDESIIEIEYENGFDPQTGASNFVPANALTEIEIEATK